jgi:hypothetical protein
VGFELTTLRDNNSDATNRWKISGLQTHQHDATEGTISELARRT